MRRKLTKKQASEFFHVRMVTRGYWTYDLYIPESVPEFSVGECSSRKDAERKAANSVNRLIPESYTSLTGNTGISSLSIMSFSALLTDLGLLK